MKIIPAILDARPSYMAGAGPAASLLSAPVGPDTLATRLHDRFGRMASRGVVILPTFPPSAEYVAAMRAHAFVNDVTPLATIREASTTYEVSDWLLLTDARVFPLGAVPIERLLESLSSDQRTASHLVAMRSNPGGAVERVQFTADGQVRAIQRYYDARTWNFASGVVCSLVPVAALVAGGQPWLPFATLTELRGALALQGVPCRDLPLSGEVLDLAREDGLLLLNERMAIEAQRSKVAVAAGATLHDSVTLQGPVVVHPRAVLEAGARVVGPAVIGEGAHVGKGAFVTQCVIGPGVRVAAEARLTQRAVFEDARGRLEPDALAERAASLDVLALDDTAKGIVPVYAPGKVLFDCIVALVGLLLAAPLMAAIAIAIRIDSPGPIFYADIRETLGGRLFRCWKFRTMYHGANERQRAMLAENEVDGPQFKIEGDPRITRLGRWLRKVSFDELPQLYNVLVGDMSLVGPRPSPFRENQVCIPWRKARLSVRAGITGLWQVCRHDRTTGDFHQWIHYDLLYARHMSALVDLKILVATVVTMGGVGRVPVHWIIPQAVSAHDPFEERRESHAVAVDPF